MSISVIILTYNEEKHIERAIKSILYFANEIFIVDSYSTDGTVEIAESLGAKVYKNKWINYATQFNWALENLPIKTEWVMRLDADEIVTPELAKEIKERLPSLEKDITGIYVKRRIYFMGRWIKHGGIYPLWFLRIWRKGYGFCEKRWMDEHTKIIGGRTIKFKGDIIDYNLNNITWYVSKYNKYATREAIDMLNLKYKIFKYDNIKPRLFGNQEERKRFFKEKVYANVPLFLRPFLYFIYRYVIKLGFLDGKEGFLFHVFQGFIYRFLVDLKIYEIEKKALIEKKNIREIVEQIMEKELLK